MTLVVDAPASYEPERLYALGVVLSEWLGLDWRLRVDSRHEHMRITLEGDGAQHGVVIPDGLFATDPRNWLTTASLPRSPLPWRPGPGGRLPVLYGADRAPSTLLEEDGEGLHLGADVFGSAFFMLTRYEEVVLPARDAYGRFPASASIAYREGFLGLPIVDGYVDLLWSALRRLWPRLERKPPALRLFLTHDVDDPLSFLGRSAPGLARQLAADGLVRRDLSLAVRRVRSWFTRRGADHRLDPHNTFDFLMDVSERHGIVSAFNFLATKDRSSLDGFYGLDHPWIRSLIKRIHQRGHEIGFHAGFHTYRDAARTDEEFRRLRTAADQLGVVQDRWGGRQHYLRWESPGTWANWEHAGLDYDSTVGFADHVGFRVGTCHAFPTFHLRERRTLKLWERPLHVMDRSLFDYMALDPETALATVLDLTRACRTTGGILTLLWHNSTLPTARQQRWYEAMIAAVAQASSSP
jgi:hypothetical protein